MSGFAMLAGVLKAGNYLSAFTRFLALGMCPLTGITVMELLLCRRFGKVSLNIPLAAWLFGTVAGLSIWAWQGENAWMLSVALLSACAAYTALRWATRNSHTYK